jgi:hypothetical protein
MDSSTTLMFSIGNNHATIERAHRTHSIPCDTNTTFFRPYVILFLTQVMFDDWEIDTGGNALELLFAHAT